MSFPSQMHSPRISIIIPSYNQGHYLEETILSVTSQSYPNLELIVVDGGSKDNSVDIIRRYEKHIQWWVSEKDKGQSEALNKGLSKATGEIINWMGSDDLLLPDSLQKVAEIFSSQPPDVGLIHGGTRLFTDKKIIRDDWGASIHSTERYFAGMAFSQPSAFFLRKYFVQAGGRLNEELHYGMDYDLYVRLACFCRFVPVRNVFSKYRLHESSKSMAEEHRFSEDWTSVFVNLCKNLGWDELLDVLKTPGVVDENILSFHYPYTFKPVEELVANLDKDKILFYHLCSLLKSFYHTGSREKARALAGYMRKKYPLKQLLGEKHISQVLTRLKMPDPILDLFIHLKKAIKIY